MFMAAPAVADPSILKDRQAPRPPRFRCGGTSGEGYPKKDIRDRTCFYSRLSIDRSGSPRELCMRSKPKHATTEKVSNDPSRMVCRKNDAKVTRTLTTKPKRS